MKETIKFLIEATALVIELTVFFAFLNHLLK